ncbi:L-xylulokinase [Lactobacillus bombicola]|uniref:L-xylulokinase n=2 Tax=Lactobacillus bombicola TaxID=1505723 RepID=A0A1I1SW87_9LACO|nr:FGGY-family carbohydrate kinase [Lactobacillus bombicola]SFD48163.1 L-xylulokinase [Lactobacillus bombicola]
MNYFLTIDNGGTNTKVVICNELGQQLGLASFPTKRVSSQPDFQEIKLSTLLVDIGRVIQEALHNAHLKATQISAVTVVGHGKGLYALDKEGKIFMNGILSTDSRAKGIATELNQQLVKIYALSHQQIMASQAPVILRWLKDNQPVKYNQIGYILSNKDFIRYLLTGNILQELGDASGNNLINLTTKQYDTRLYDFFGISEISAKLPPLINATDLAGHITSQAAKITGLVSGTPVYGGMFDIDACALATGVLDDSLFSMIAGTWNMNIFPSHQLAPLDSGLMNSIFPTGDNLIEASSPTSAGNLDMMLKILLADEIQNAKQNHKSIYDYLEQMLDTTKADYAQLFFFPFLYGSNINPNAEGAFIGLQSSTTKTEMIRAVYEGICFAHRYHLDQLLKILGHNPTAIRMSGGACNSKHWVQMFADILNLPVEITAATELGGLGGAITCAVGRGVYPDLPTAVGKMTKVTAQYQPCREETRIYNQKYQVYCSLLQALDGAWNNLSKLKKELNVYHDN